MTSPAPLPAARTTVVVSFRERWGWTQAVVERLLAHTPPEVPVWVLDTGLPPALRQTLQVLADATPRLALLPLPSGLWPQQARGAIAAQIGTPYAVFIDNDVLVRPGWLEPLLDCAEATGAGIVGPLYLWGDDETSELVHMAGGQLEIQGEAPARVMGEWHRHINRQLADIQPPLQRSVCDFAEYHCLLMRREVFQDPEIFDPVILCVHEHIHASLRARELGYATWLEPATRVLYAARQPWLLDELPLLAQRWAPEAAEQSLQRFSQRWGVIDDARSFGGIREYVHQHVGRYCPLRPSLQTPGNAHQPMQRADLEQTPAGLLHQARQRGYLPAELQDLSNALLLATRLFNGGYRPCGRPFVNHAIGTTSVLVYYGAEMRLVLAGLLHAAYTHTIPVNTPNPALVAHQLMAALGGPQATLERQVRAYTLRQQRYPQLLAQPPEALLASDAELLLLDVANEVDMLLSLEVLASGRQDLMPAPVLALALDTCQRIGAPGLGQTLQAQRQNLADTPEADLMHLQFHPQPGSFRLLSQGTVAMAGPLVLPVLEPTTLAAPSVAQAETA